MANEPDPKQPLGLIAGNGRFPFLLLDAARAHGRPVVVAAIREETDAAMNARAAEDSWHDGVLAFPGRAVAAD